MDRRDNQGLPQSLADLPGISDRERERLGRLPMDLTESPRDVSAEIQRENMELARKVKAARKKEQKRYPWREE